MTVGHSLLHRLNNKASTGAGGRYKRSYFKAQKQLMKERVVSLLFIELSGFDANHSKIFVTFENLRYVGKSNAYTKVALVLCSRKG